MQVDVIVLIGLVGTVCGIAGFFGGKKKENTQQGQQQGQLETDIKYIKTGIDDIKKTVSEHEAKIWDLVKEVVGIKESVKSAHHRIDGFQKRGDD